MLAVLCSWVKTCHRDTYRHIENYVHRDLLVDLLCSWVKTCHPTCCQLSLSLYIYIYSSQYIIIYGNYCHGSSEVDHHLHHTSDRTRSSRFPILFLYKCGTTSQNQHNQVPCSRQNTWMICIFYVRVEWKSQMLLSKLVYRALLQVAILPWQIPITVTGSK